MTADFLARLDSETEGRREIGPGAILLRGFARAAAPDLLTGIEAVAAAAPFRHMATPGGRAMSVAMTCCGALGWVTDRRGYRYQVTDPASAHPWPALPAGFADLAARSAEAAGFSGFSPSRLLKKSLELP